MALKNQVANVYGVGINNVGSYQVAGRPFCMTGSVTEEDEITFPQVTKQITVMNRGSNDIYVYFSASAPDAFANQCELCTNLSYPFCMWQRDS